MATATSSPPPRFTLTDYFIGFPPKKQQKSGRKPPRRESGQKKSPVFRRIPGILHFFGEMKEPALPN